jgi:hypothetical protein
LQIANWGGVPWLVGYSALAQSPQIPNRFLHATSLPQNRKQLQMKRQAICNLKKFSGFRL